MRASTSTNALLLLTLAAGLIVGLGSPSAAEAQAGSFRLGADLSVLTVQHYPNPELFDPPDPTVIFGVYSTVAGFESALLFAPQFAYAITDQIVVGGHVGFAAASFFGSDVGFGFHILPFFEYLFLNSDIRPFVGAELGPRLVAIPNAGSDLEMTFLWGALGGVHIFTGSDFSVSPFVRFDVTYYTGSERAGYEAVLGVSFEGWMGGNRQDDEPAAATPEPAPAPAYNPPPPAETTTSDDTGGDTGSDDSLDLGY